MLRAIKVNDRFDVMSILTAHVLPELQAPDVNALPVIKADAVKFATTFRNQLTRAQLSAFAPLLVNLVGSTHHVVHTYAAHAVERFLTARRRV